MEQKIVDNKDKLFVSNKSEKHYVKIAANSKECIAIWVKEPTYLQLEQAQMKMFNVDMKNQDIQLQTDNMFQYLWDAFVEKTDPHLTYTDLIRLKPYVGRQIREILPDPFNIMEVDADLKAK